MKEKALRDSQKRSIHEIGELKRSRRILCTKIGRKSLHDAETHFTNTRGAREGELHE